MPFNSVLSENNIKCKTDRKQKRKSKAVRPGQLTALLLILTLCISGALSYIFASKTKVNIFTVGNLSLELHENGQYITNENGGEILIQDAKVINRNLSDIYNEKSADGSFVITMYDSSGSEVDSINEAAYFTAVNGDECVKYTADGNTTVEANGINDFAEKIVMGQKISIKPWIRNTCESASCHVFIIAETPTVSVTESYVNNGIVANSDRRMNIKIHGLAVQEGFGGIDVTDSKYLNNGEKLASDIWERFRMSVLPKERVDKDRVGIVRIKEANDGWSLYDKYEGLNGSDYYIFGYNSMLAAGESTSIAFDDAEIVGYTNKTYSISTLDSTVDITPNNSWAQGQTHAMIWNVSYLDGADGTNLNTGSVTETELNSENGVKMKARRDGNGYWQFYIELNDGNMICTNYYPNMKANSAWKNVDSGRDISTNNTLQQIRFNTEYKKAATNLKYTVPAFGAAVNSAVTYAASGNGYYSANTVMATMAGVPVYIADDSLVSQQYCQLMPLNTIMIKQEDGSYRTYTLNDPAASATQVIFNSKVFYDGSYAEWLEACINTGRMTGSFGIFA